MLLALSGLSLAFGPTTTPAEKPDVAHSYMPIYDYSSVPLDYVDCFWREPFYYGGKVGEVQGWSGSINANICDISATYWFARIRLPLGAKLVFKGEFGQNRYASFSSYGITDPTDSLDDYTIVPDKGSVNPYLDGNLRTLPMSQRRFTAIVLNDVAPEKKEDRAPNTLYARPSPTDLTPEAIAAGDYPDDTTSICVKRPELTCADELTLVDLRWRSYLPDRSFDQAMDARGGGKLPFPEYIEYADGTRKYYEGKCDMDPTEMELRQARGFTNSAISIKQMTDLWGDPEYLCSNATVAKTYDKWCNDPWVAPATDPPRFEKFFGIKYSYDSLFYPQVKRDEIRAHLIKPRELGGMGINCESGASTVGAPGIPANFNSNYGIMFIAQKFGKIMHVKAKKIRTVKTYHEGKTFDHDGAQLRFWSWTIGNERTTGQISGGVVDEMFPDLKTSGKVDTVDEGYYSMVVSLPEDRPKTATQECGHGWLNWNRRGDGTGRWGITALVLRHMMQMDDSFTGTMMKVCEPGKEEEFMGEYFPRGHYYSTPDEFDAKVGCLDLA